MKRIGLLLSLIVIIGVFPSFAFAEPAQPVNLKAAIIIDDFGGGTGGVRDFLEGDIPITAAVMLLLKTREVMPSGPIKMASK